MSFKYVYIPSIESHPMRELSASKEGGLQGDFLRRHAEITFARDSNLIDRSKQMAGIQKQSLVVRIYKKIGFVASGTNGASA